MTDQELRDKLASEGIISEMSGELVPRWHQADFKAGWDAARANQVDGWLAQDMGLHVTNIDNLIKERDQLRIEIERLKNLPRISWSFGNLEELVKENDQLKAQCEKLVEALAHLYECELQEWGKEEWEVDEKDTSALGKAKQVLAEYRKQFPKDKE